MNKRWSKEVRGLLQKKKRKETNRFIVEGYKNIEELLNSSMKVHALFHTDKLSPAITQDNIKNIEIIDSATTSDQLKSNGHLKTNDTGIAVVEIPSYILPVSDQLPNFCLALDDVKDPGNLGTIIRVADWYGIEHIFLSKECTDPYAPKVVASTMGAFTRVKCHVVDLPQILSTFKEKGVQIIGADMDGKDIHQFIPDHKSIMVMGSESHGISKEVHDILTTKITIPRYGGAESLNVAIATAVICDNIKRI